MVGGCFRQESRITHGKLLVMVYKVGRPECMCKKGVCGVCVGGWKSANPMGSCEVGVSVKLTLVDLLQ